MTIIRFIRDKLSTISDELKNRYLTSLFVQGEQEYDETVIYRIVPHYFKTFGTVRLGVHDYRHANKAFLEAFSSEEKQIQFMFSLQAGHSIRTGTTNYASSNEDLGQFSRQTFSLFSAASRCWHEFLDLQKPEQSSGDKAPLDNSLNSQFGQVLEVVSSLRAEVKRLADVPEKPQGKLDTGNKIYSNY